MANTATTIIYSDVPLKPCPFCGKVPIIKQRNSLQGFVCPPETVCSGAKVFTVFDPGDIASAIAWWNTRASVLT